MGTAHPLTVFRKSQQPPLSQRQLGELLGVDRLTIHRWETGKRNPSPERVPQISRKTGIPPQKLRPDLADMLGGRV